MSNTIRPETLEAAPSLRRAVINVQRPRKGGSGGFQHWAPFVFLAPYTLLTLVLVGSVGTCDASAAYSRPMIAPEKKAFGRLNSG